MQRDERGRELGLRESREEQKEVGGEKLVDGRGNATKKKQMIGVFIKARELQSHYQGEKKNDMAHIIVLPISAGKKIARTFPTLTLRLDRPLR